MYISPINITYKTSPIAEEIQQDLEDHVHTVKMYARDAFEKSIEENCFKVAYKYGIDINEEELIAALKADRKRYEEAYNRGYSAGQRNAFDKLETFKNTGMWEVSNDDKL